MASIKIVWDNGDESTFKNCNQDSVSKAKKWISERAHVTPCIYNDDGSEYTTINMEKVRMIVIKDKA